MEIVVAFVAVLVLFDLAALRWGFDSRPLGKPPEWPPRRERPVLNQTGPGAGIAMRAM